MNPEAIAVLAGVTTVIQLTWQAAEILRADSVGNVSVATWILIMVQGIGLAAYCLSANLVVAGSVNVFVTASACVILFRTLSGPSRMSMLAGVTLSVGLVPWILDAGFESELGSIGAAAAAVAWLPQVVAFLRFDPRSAFSSTAWILVLLTSGLWLAYSVAVGQWRVGVGPAFGILAAFLGLRASLRSRP